MGFGSYQQALRFNRKNGIARRLFLDYIPSYVSRIDEILWRKDGNFDEESATS